MCLLHELHKRTKENVALASTVSKLGKPGFQVGPIPSIPVFYS